MRAEIHEGTGLQYVTVVPDEYTPEDSYPLVVMLHGFGANMQDLAGLAPAINPTGYVYACPNAPIPFNLGPGHTGFGWMTPRGGGTPEETANSESLLSDFFDTVFQQFNVSPGDALLLGFSQGGGMTYRCGLGDSGRFAALVALSATLPDQDELATKLPEERTQPIFVAHGTHDQMVSVDTAHSAKSFLEGNGYSPEFHIYSMGHEISNDVLNDLIPWIAKVLPPLKAGD
ncbi:MAG: dienelactone hydrolase family protein [SAR202 cluster bacterium]|nr:dienelactone hydrolase family protein [SAR202 cluster bacterium]